MFKKNIFWIICLYLLLAVTGQAWGQQIILDKPVRAGELILFPDLSDPNTYYYVPDKPRIASDPTTGKPMFSFLRYLQNVQTAGSNEGEGGGIVHAVVTLEVTPEQRSRAEQELRRVNSSGRIVGPIIYSGGTIALVSSFAKADGTLTQQVVGLGKAPILEGQKAAISVQLTKLGAKILWESFQTPTPDMSVSFEMEMKGFRSPKRAIIEANFDQVYEHKSFELGASGNMGPVVLAAEIKAAFDDLVKTGAIKVTQIGTDENMEKAIEDAYGKLTRMMFEPASGTGTPNLGQLTSVAGGQSSMLDRATNMLNQARRETREDNQRNLQFALENDIGPHDIRRGSSSSRDNTSTGGAAFTPPRSVPHDEASRLEQENERGRRAREAQQNQVPLPSLAIAASFQMKRVRQQGIFRIDLNKYTADNLTLRFDGNFGNIQCQQCFHSVNLDDPLYRQRQITAFLDGMNTDDFGKYINFVDVQIRKTHQSGEVTTEEVTVDRKNFNGEGNNFNFVYSWKGDDDRRKWLNYEYRTVWNFFGGFSKPIEWTPTQNATIPLSPPYVRRLIDVEADPNTIKDAGIRAIELMVYFPLGEKEQTRQFRLNVRSGQLSTQIDIFQQPNQLDYEYEVKWYLNDGSAKQSGRQKSNSSVLFVDNI